MQSGTNKAENKHYSIWYGYSCPCCGGKESKFTRKIIRQQQAIECKKELTNYFNEREII